MHGTGERISPLAIFSKVYHLQCDCHSELCFSSCSAVWCLQHSFTPKEVSCAFRSVRQMGGAITGAGPEPASGIGATAHQFLTLTDSGRSVVVHVTIVSSPVQRGAVISMAKDLNTAARIKTTFKSYLHTTSITAEMLVRAETHLDHTTHVPQILAGTTARHKKGKICTTGGAMKAHTVNFIVILHTDASSMADWNTAA